MWRTVELREIRVFLTLADELHFGRTADRLGLTQSRVSQTIRALETKLGDQLVQRTSRRSSLTTAGERLRTQVEPAYKELLSPDSSAHPVPARHSTEGVRLGVTYAAAVTPELLRVIEAFEGRYPQCRVEIVEFTVPRAPRAAAAR
jgi:DNA-binding transcriptional LysR family regulator